MTKMRYFSGSFWTPKKDAQLQRLEAKGLSAAQIAEKLGTSRNSVSGRSQRLRGVNRRFPSFLRREREARARSAARQKDRQRKTDAVLAKFRQDLARGVARYVATIQARKAGVTLQAIGDVLGVTKERVRQLINQQ